MFRNLALTLILAAAVFVPAKTQAQTEYDRSYWGWNVGGVFTDIPISVAIDSGFAVLMSNAYYGRYLTDPTADFRTAFTLGLYGFQLILPVPVVGMDVFLGNRESDLQFKGTVGGFYDITVGGHAGMALGIGALFKDRFNVSFFAVPFGKDADKDYLSFVGTRDEAINCKAEGVDCVKMPYFGVFVGFQY